MKKTSTISNILLWLGASISVAELLTGALIAPLGFAKGAAAMLIGHLIGGVFLYLAGLLCARAALPSIAPFGIPFGRYGTYGLSLLNIIQLTGWTAVMIVSTASILTPVFAISQTVWCCLIGGLIGIWLLCDANTHPWLNNVAVVGLGLLTLVLGWVVFRGDAGAVANFAPLSFGGALELGIVMPLSWLPVIGDYTINAKHPARAALWSVVAYTAGSCLMYIIGMAAALYCGTSDIAVICTAAGLGVVGLLILILSTVTTTFLDAYSAGVSATALSGKLKARPVSLVVCLLGTILAIFTPIERYQDFLSLIGSVFAPAAAILITDYFLLKRRDATLRFRPVNALLWVIGFALYRYAMTLDLWTGSSLPVMLLICLMTLVAAQFKTKKGVDSHAK